MALCVASPLIPSEGVTKGVGIGLVMAWLVVLFTTCATTATAARPRLRFQATDAALLVFLLLHTISALVMAGHGQPRQTFHMMWQWISLGASFFLMRQLIRGAIEARAVVVVMVALAVCVAMHGYYQYFYSLPRDIRMYEADPDGELLKAGINAPPGSIIRKQFESRLRSAEPIATFTLTNSLAGLLAPWLLFAVATGVLSRGTNAKRLRVAAALSAFLIGGCLVLTKSRTAWLAVVCGFAFLMVYGRRTGWRPGWKAVSIGGGTIAALFLIGVGVGAVDIEVLTESSKSLLYRAQYWHGTMGVIREHPLFGCGPGNFQQYYPAHKLPAASETIADPHNFLLEVWASAGTPALLALVAVFVCFAVAIARPARQIADAEEQHPDATESERPVYWGALVGGPLAIGIGLVVQHQPPMEVFLVGFPIATFVVVAWHDWVVKGELGLLPLSAALLGLAINLLAAGGISFAGVSLTIWVLLAVGLNHFASGDDWRAPSQAVVGGIAIAALLLLGGFWFTTFQPVLNATNEIDAAMAQLQLGRFPQGEQHLVAAAEADPYDARAWRELANLRNHIWLNSPNERGEAAFRQAMQGLLDRDKHSEGTLRECGNWLVNAFRRTGSQGYLEEALEFYREAGTLYPNYNLGRAQIAWTLHLLGRPDAAQAAEEALRLDSLNPHSEQRLAVRLLYDRPANTAGQPPSAADRDAEQLMDELRKLLRK